MIRWNLADRKGSQRGVRDEQVFWRVKAKAADEWFLKWWERRKELTVQKKCSSSRDLAERGKWPWKYHQPHCLINLTNSEFPSRVRTVSGKVPGYTLGIETGPCVVTLLNVLNAGLLTGGFTRPMCYLAQLLSTSTVRRSISGTWSKIDQERCDRSEDGYVSSNLSTLGYISQTSGWPSEIRAQQMIIAAPSGQPRIWIWVRVEVLNDSRPDRREYAVDVEQADEEDDISEIEEEVKNEDDPFDGFGLWSRGWRTRRGYKSASTKQVRFLVSGMNAQAFFA
ncbi:hypothetical protein BJ322DRAFT_131405 [Thelephora terrestris]|uniref:Uncharacterized protein n=1 Tax=Thelephora terrestris TaxID=56493 RepID=A0A9P6HSZ5_9AGAM|nr:hypothetical protein BJ322DRAFT_131405 [Thelephora terrestris]